MQWAQKQKGFTIVELLIVIVVIAILASIVIVGYRSIVNNARTLTVANSLGNAADAMKLALLNNPSQSTLPSDIKIDDDIVLNLAGASSGEYCINAYRISSWEVGSYDSRTGQTRPYLCAGLPVGSPVGGSLPAVPTKINLIAPDFADWKLVGGVTYDTQTKELTFAGASGSATSPPVRLAGSSASAAFTYELFSTLPSPNSTPQTATYSSSAYYGSDGTTLVQSSAGYTGNGNAQVVPLNAWTARTWVVTTGPNVQYVRFIINLSPTTYTSNNFKVRNPRIEKYS